MFSFGKNDDKAFSCLGATALSNSLQNRALQVCVFFCTRYLRLQSKNRRSTARWQKSSKGFAKFSLKIAAKRRCGAGRVLSAAVHLSWDSDAPKTSQTSKKVVTREEISIFCALFRLYGEWWWRLAYPTFSVFTGQPTHTFRPVPPPSARPTQAAQ